MRIWVGRVGVAVGRRGVLRGAVWGGGVDEDSGRGCLVLSVSVPAWFCSEGWLRWVRAVPGCLG